MTHGQCHGRLERIATALDAEMKMCPTVSWPRCKNAEEIAENLIHPIFHPTNPPQLQLKHPPRRPPEPLRLKGLIGEVLDCGKKAMPERLMERLERRQSEILFLPKGMAKLVIDIGQVEKEAPFDQRHAKEIEVRINVKISLRHLADGRDDERIANVQAYFRDEAIKEIIVIPGSAERKHAHTLR
jgi:hypothetical protein